MNVNWHTSADADVLTDVAGLEEGNSTSCLAASGIHFANGRFGAGFNSSTSVPRYELRAEASLQAKGQCRGSLW
jgi:hypothetical protein